MKLKNTLLAVTDMNRSLAFYKTVLGLRVVRDFGANKTLTGGLCLQTAESWQALLGGAAVRYGGGAGELYFEEEDFDGFVRRLTGQEIRYVHPVTEQPWGQRAVRFYDPDGHIIEVGESLQAVCRRFAQSGLTPEQIARRMDVPLPFVQRCLKQRGGGETEQVRRIRRMEDILDRALAALNGLPKTAAQLQALRPEIDELTDYYESPQWTKDYTDDAQGRLPRDLKRGVLSQDAVYDFLAEYAETL